MRVTGIRSERSTGIGRYCLSLADAMAGAGVAYALATGPVTGTLSHWHLGNSSRRGILLAPRSRAPYVLTVHDVIPRTPWLAGIYRAAVYPGIVHGARRIIVHSHHAADLLLGVAGIDRSRIEVIPHGAHPCQVDRATAREALGWPAEGRIAVLPGVVKRAKLVAAAVEAIAPLMADGTWTLALAGRVVDRSAAREAADLGAIVLESPDDVSYDDAIAAADVVLVLRSGSVGETNGPLLDAFGAGRAVIGTAAGSLPELADGAALLTTPEPAAIRAALETMSDVSVRDDYAARGASRGHAFAWERSAEAHRELFAAVAHA
jgi:glycosyltransferase involved in cell wall biosynthesis